MLITTDNKLLATIAKIHRLKRFPSVNVLIHGETGTGKQELASMFDEEILPHQTNKVPFVEVNCNCLTESLAEAELFGSAKGAYTGSVADRIGYIEAAHGGTLFLDEVQDLPLMVQGKLLKVLEGGSFSRLGDPKGRKASFRVVSATNNLAKLKDPEQFRSDLYYRLFHLMLTIPPLRDRPLADRFALAEHFTKGKMPRSVVTGWLNDKNKHWLGNVRELQRDCIAWMALEMEEL